jgi:hypothetical protein
VVKKIRRVWEAAQHCFNLHNLRMRLDECWGNITFLSFYWMMHDMALPRHYKFPFWNELKRYIQWRRNRETLGLFKITEVKDDGNNKFSNFEGTFFREAETNGGLASHK